MIDDFYDLLTTHGHLPEMYKTRYETVLIKEEPRASNDDDVNMSDAEQTNTMPTVDVAAIKIPVHSTEYTITARDGDEDVDETLLQPMSVEETQTKHQPQPAVPKTIFRCNKCGKQSTRKRRVAKHVCISSVAGVIETIIVPDPSAEFTITPCDDEHEQDPAAKQTQFRCEICGKKSTRKRRLANHLCVTTPQIFTCDYCGKQLTNKGSLVKHMLVHSITERPLDSSKKYTCEYCGKQMAHMSNLTVHKRIHTGEKPFRCQFCVRCFTNSTERNHHQHTHTGEQPFKCDQCDRRFSIKQNMMDHIRTRHNDERPYKCDTCGSTFKTLECYRNHLKIHTDERPHTCDVCGNSFRQRSAYMVHMNIHSDHRPYKCGQCERGFHSPAARHSHEKIFHKLP